MLSIGKSAESQVWENDFEIDWGALREHVCKSPWSHIIWMPAVRREQNFYCSKFVALDFDGGVTKAEIVSRFEAEGLSYLIAPSRSDGVSKDGKPPQERFRAVLEWGEVIFKPDIYKYNVKKLIEKYGADPAGGDLARMWFPSKTVLVQRWFQCGQVVVDKNIPYHETAEFKQAELNKHLEKYRGKKSIPKRVLNFINGDVPPGKRNSELFYAVVTLLSIGKKEEDFLPGIRALPFFYEINGETTINSARKKFHRGELK